MKKKISIVSTFLFLLNFLLVATAFATTQINSICRVTWDVGENIPEPYYFGLLYRDRMGTPPFEIICRSPEPYAPYPDPENDEFFLIFKDEEGIVLPLEKFQVFTADKRITINKEYMDELMILTISYPAGVGGPGSHWKGQVFIVLPPKTLKSGENWRICITAERNAFPPVFEGQTSKSFNSLGIWWEMQSNFPLTKMTKVCKDFSIAPAAEKEEPQRLGFSLTSYSGTVWRGKLKVKEIRLIKK